MIVLARVRLVCCDCASKSYPVGWYVVTVLARGNYPVGWYV